MRKSYTLFDLLGDFGGFNDAIYFLISLPMSLYSASMFDKFIKDQQDGTNGPENETRNLNSDAHRQFLNKLKSDDVIDEHDFAHRSLLLSIFKPMTKVKRSLSIQFKNKLYSCCSSCRKK